MFNGLSADNVDPFYPKAWSGSTVTTAERVDMCLGHPQIAGMYHYHMMPACLYDSAKAATAGSCDGVAACKSDIRTYALSGFSTK
jgi:hypothetical protein